MKVTEVHNDWGKRLRKRRGEMGLSQARLAELVSVTQATISNVEKGACVPSDNLKWRLAGALGCLITDLFPYPAHRPEFPEPVPARRVAS